MTTPTTQIVQMQYQNPHASMLLYVPVAVVCNTSDEALERNIRANSALPLKWLAAKPAHEGVAVLCGGGASIAEHVDDIRAMQKDGAKVFAMNGAASYLGGLGILPDYQVIADAKQETSQLVSAYAGEYLFASQVHPDTVQVIADHPQILQIWHLEIGEIERFFPEDRLKRGGYALIGGGAAVGNSALCVAYAMGYRNLHVFGFDSCHRDGKSHAYAQPMNDFIPCVDVEWGGKVYTASVAMKAQAEKFQITAQALEQAGCEITVYGGGLLQTMYNSPPQDLTERDKYRLIWQFDGYREFSPGEEIVGKFLEVARPDGLIVDFGCGTGRAALALHKAGHEVFLVDFADNCRDEEALVLPFLEWDLCLPCPVSAAHGLCTDVMEHIPTEKVGLVIENIMASAKAVFFQISTVQDCFGDMIHQRLHNTVKDHVWWVEQFRALGFEIQWQEERDNASCFLVTH
jgi:uncharacterized Rossmann fold enzyme